MSLIKQFNREENEISVQATTLTESWSLCLERSDILQSVKPSVLVETAATFLAQYINQIQHNQVKDAETALDVITVLYVLADQETREAIHDHVNAKQFSVIVRRLGDHEKVLKFVKQQAKIPALHGQREKVKKLLTTSDETREDLVQQLRKLRMAYERINLQILQQRKGTETDPDK